MALNGQFIDLTIAKNGVEDPRFVVRSSFNKKPEPTSPNLPTCRVTRQEMVI